MTNINKLTALRLLQLTGRLLRTAGGRPRGPLAFGVKDIWNYIRQLHKYATIITKPQYFLPMQLQT